MSVGIKRIERLWVNMQALYGSRWLLEYGQATGPDGQLCEIAKIWAKSLDEASHDQIAAGIRQCIARDSEHPPSLPEFLRLCGAMRRAATYPLLPPSAREPAAMYRDPPAAQCARLAETLAAEARATLDGGPDPDLPEALRRDILRGYWMTKIGETGLGKTIARQWAQPGEEAA